MLSRSSTAAKTVRSAKFAKKAFRNYSELPPVGDQKAAGKPFSLTRFLFRLSLLTAGVYGVGATAALIYEPLQDKYVETFPYGEEVLDKFDYTWRHRKELKKSLQDFDYKTYYNEKYSGIAESVNDKASQLGLDDYINIPHKGAISKPASTKDLETKKEDKFLILSNSDEKNSNSKPVDVVKKAPAPAPASAPAPVVEEKKIVLPTISIKSSDSTVNSLVGELNNLINDFNGSKLNEKSNVLIEKISSSLTELSTKFNAPSNADIKKFEEEKLKALQLQFAKEKTDLTLKLTETLNHTKSELEEKHQVTLANEVNQIRKSLELEFENRLKQKEIELLEELNKSVSTKIETERDSKLKDLDSLSKRIDSIEQFELKLSEVATTYTTFKEIRQSISKINLLLSSNESSSIRGQNLVDEIEVLKKLTKPLNNDLINETINSLPSNNELLKNGGVLTQSQILTRWELLAPKLREVSLLPENAGILGYAASSLFSKFLWSKNGVPTEGNDVESVIARVNDYLHKNQLDSAVEQVTNLKGDSRMLANDWLVDARRKLEMQFLVDLLSTEVNVSA